mmetsp:Transcript_18393/g.42952  ORF Transcript_18393/g.42952 Transcript_18393/m.42952 type:complete len:228 (-) Transcript_18393:5664-6347(-)
MMCTVFPLLRGSLKVNASLTGTKEFSSTRSDGQKKDVANLWKAVCPCCEVVAGTSASRCVPTIMFQKSVIPLWMDAVGGCSAPAAAAAPSGAERPTIRAIAGVLDFIASSPKSSSMGGVASPDANDSVRIDRTSLSRRLCGRALLLIMPSPMESASSSSVATLDTPSSKSRIPLACPRRIPSDAIEEAAILAVSSPSVPEYTDPALLLRPSGITSSLLCFFFGLRCA